MPNQFIKIEAVDKRAGMSIDEIFEAVNNARTQDFTKMGRTRVGFRGQVLEMNFEKPEVKDAKDVRPDAHNAVADPGGSGGAGGG